jgi:catechol 2,3-dioxygenase-like lactoylglutathione lyase family enzyme
MDRPPHAGLRHLALNVRSLDDMKRFYVDLLGFTIEWEPDPDNVYLSSGIDNLALHRSADASRSDMTDASRSGVADASRLRSPESDASSPPPPAGIDERQASARSRRSSSQSNRTEADGEVRHSAEGATAARVSNSALDHLGLIVRSADDVDRWAAFLEGHGVVIDARPRTHRDGARSCYFRDPDGNHVQIIHHPPISGRI